jgi:hypothetical protein
MTMSHNSQSQQVVESTGSRVAVKKKLDRLQRRRDIDGGNFQRYVNALKEHDSICKNKRLTLEIHATAGGRFGFRQKTACQPGAGFARL